MEVLASKHAITQLAPEDVNDPSNGKCPFLAMQDGINKSTAKKLNLNILNQPNYSAKMGTTRAEYERNYIGNDPTEYAKFKEDLVKTLKDSKEWWPADYGHYGPFMVRLAWHSAGTYRIFDGRGGANSGNMRFNPLGSWPDNGNLDKARRLLWPMKKQYGNRISWGDLMILAADIGMEDMGFKTFGFGGGRVDCWAPEEDIYWGTEQSYVGLNDSMDSVKKLEKPLGNVVQSLIYVNPQGPGDNADPLMAATHIRETFGRMAMNDEETVALIAGGHTFGKGHGASTGDNCGPPPSDAAIEEQGFGWTSGYKSGKGPDAITSGLEGAWTEKPTEWDHGYFTNLFKYEYEKRKGPGGGWQWYPVAVIDGSDGKVREEVPDAHDPAKKHTVMMFTTDLSLIKDPAYLEVSKRYLADPELFRLNFAKAWYKLTHRDMGPVKRCLGPDVAPAQLWQDPVPPSTNGPIDDGTVAKLKGEIRGLGLSAAELVSTAWASASTFRCTDFRGGANGARIALEPQRSWAANSGAVGGVVAKLQGIQTANAGVSLADLIVLAGTVGVEDAAGGNLEVPFKSGRGDATQETTDVNSFAVLEPESDAFRNFKKGPQKGGCAPYELVDKAHLLSLTTPEMGVLLGGLRAIGVGGGADGKLGLVTETPGTLNNAFFVNLCDMKWKWENAGDHLYNGVSRDDGGASGVKFTASGADLAFGSNGELRAIAEQYAQDDQNGKFQKDFAAAWGKVMGLDLF